MAHRGCEAGMGEPTLDLNFSGIPHVRPSKITVVFSRGNLINRCRKLRISNAVTTRGEIINCYTVNPAK